MTKTTESLVSKFEALELGEAWLELFEAAKQACLSDRFAAESRLFPLAIEPTTVDALQLYEWHISRLSTALYGDQLALVHERAIESHPALAALCRSHDALEDVFRAGGLNAVPENTKETHANAALRAGERARRKYQRLIARHLAGFVGHPLAPVASAMLEAEAREARVMAAKERHEEAARREIERIEAERQASARAESTVAIERVRAAEAAAADARSKALLAEREYRALRAESLAKRLRASGLKELRVGSGDGRQLYDVAELVAGASNNQYGLEQLARYEEALARHEAG